MKVLLFGRNGQVGWELNRSLTTLGEIVALGRAEADFSKPEGLRRIVQDIKPDVIVNAVAYTAVDNAEEEESLAMTINATAVGVLAEEAKKNNVLLIHYSTDYVFDGTKNSHYLESDKPNPINAYGRTKLAGELAIQTSGCDYLIFRTSWVFSARGSNFLLSIIRIACEKKELYIVDDQIGSPTSARLIADTTAHSLLQALDERQAGIFSSGLYHLTSFGSVSWYGFAVEIVDALLKKNLRLNPEVKEINPVPSSKYKTNAKRPLNSRLSIDKLQHDFKITVPNWKSALDTCLEELRSSQ